MLRGSLEPNVFFKFDLKHVNICINPKPCKVRHLRLEEEQRNPGFVQPMDTEVAPLATPLITEPEQCNRYCEDRLRIPEPW